MITGLCEKSHCFHLQRLVESVLDGDVRVSVAGKCLGEQEEPIELTMQDIFGINLQDTFVNH